MNGNTDSLMDAVDSRTSELAREDSRLEADLPPGEQEYVLELSGLCHRLVNTQTRNKDGQRAEEVYTVEIDELRLPRGEFIAIQGPSGCGKTTLLTLLGLARRPHPTIERFRIRQAVGNQGSELFEHNLCQEWKQGPRKIDRLRRKLLGFCLQRGELLENLTVAENVLMPLMINGWDAAEARERVDEVLTLLSGDFDVAESRNGDGVWDVVPELVQRKNHLPIHLSGGQYQRVALARALSHRPQVLFLDEPTGTLDPRTAENVLTALDRTRHVENVTVVMITHDNVLARKFANFIVTMGSPRERLGLISRYERNMNGEGWVETDARWNPKPSSPSARQDAHPAH